MRARLFVVLTLTTFALLILPAVSQARVTWSQSLKLNTASYWTNEQSVGIVYQGTVSWYYGDVDDDVGSEVILQVAGDVVLPSAGLIMAEDSGVMYGESGASIQFFGESTLPLTSGDGLKQFDANFYLGPWQIRVAGPRYAGKITLDTHSPKTIAPYPIACKKGGYASVSFQVDDKLSPTADVSLLIKSAAGKTVKKVSIGQKDTGKLLVYLWKCPLGKGKYTYSILATDLAGNDTSKPGKNVLIVR